MDGRRAGNNRHPTPWGTLVCLVLLVIGTVHSEEICRKGCKSAKGTKTYHLTPGGTYKYTYDGKVDISLSSAEGQTISAEIKADVILTQLPDCLQTISLKNVQILGSNGKKFGAIPDIEKPFQINIQGNGELEDSICVVDGDNQNSINIKRAIASLFQVPSESGYETDVFGLCPTQYSRHKDGQNVRITKQRNLNKCSYREHINQDFLSTALNLNSEIKSSPLLDGDYRASLIINKDGILEQATVVEDYFFVPFSVGKNGAKAQVNSKLQFAGPAGQSASENIPITKPRSIIFENPHPVVAPTSNVQTILAAVKEVAKTVDVVVGEETAREFINLLKVVKVSSKNDLLAVYNQIRSGAGLGNNKEAARRLYLDALLRAGNGETVEALLELLDKKQLSDTDSALALIGLNVVRHATEGSLKAATHLLDTPNLPREAYLGIGNLAGRFCLQHRCDNPELKALTNKLLSKIANKFSNKEQENDAIYALKALTNFRHLADNVIPKVTGLAQNKNLPNRIRVAALEAYLADPCKDKIRNSALQILQDIQQDSEVRIRAYLALAQCPNAKIGNAIKSLLAEEPSIQVGGFINSHIHALRSSANPDKALAKQFLGFVNWRSFPIDPRKYSFNGEFSYAIDTLGLGASSEANVIYSQNSWLPRSTNLNLTAELFGQSFNFLEIETRQENLDRLVEHYFGPKGVLKQAILSDIFQKGKSSYNNLAEYVENKLKETLGRSKRDVSKTEIDNVAKLMQIKTNELNKDLDLDVSLKAFGGELFFLNINQEAKVKPERIIDGIIAQLSKGLDKLQRFEETLRHNLDFLDAEIAYPTSLGFPLRLAVEGSANIQVQAEGNIDVRQLINNPDKGEIRVKLIPSANILVSARLTLDALSVETGLKVESSLYSSVGGDLKASWDKATGFDVKLGLPVQEQKLISANHEIVFVTREQAGREVNLPLKFTQQKDFSICVDQLSPFIGLTFCAEVNGPNLGGKQIPVLPFPLAGDAKFAVTIENDDVSEYHIKHTLKPAHADLVLETIGKDNKRKVSLDLQGEFDPEKFVKVIFTSPIKSASAEARIISTNVERSLFAKVIYGDESFSGKIGVAISGTPERAVYKPLLEYRTPQGQQPIAIKSEGQIVVETNGPNVKYIFQNLKVADNTREISLNGNLGRDNGVFFTDLTVSEGNHKVELESRVQLTPELVKFNIKLANTYNNNANFNLKGEFKRQPSQYDAAIQLIHGADLNSKTSILTITSSVVNKFKAPNDFRFEIKNKMSYPLLGISGKFELEETPKSLDYDINLEYGELKLGSELEAKINEKTTGDYEIDFEIWGLDNKLEVKSKRQVLPNDESKIFNTVEVNGKKVEVEGKIKHLVRPHNLDIGTELNVHIPNQAAPVKVSTALRVTQEEIDAHAKIGTGNDNVIDSFLKGNKKGNINGSLKVSLKNILNVNGQIHAAKGAGNGEILVDLQNGKRQIKADTTFSIQPAQEYDLTVNVYPSFNKDKNLVITLKTENKVSETSIDSVNKLDIVGQTLEFNLKGSRTGDDKTGKVSGELEVTLPSQHYFLAKSNCDHQEQNGFISGEQQASLEYRKNKNTPGNKYTYKSTVRNTNMKEGLIDADLNLSADDSNGKNINVDTTIKYSKNGEVRDMSFNNKVYGSVLINPLEISLVTKCDKTVTGQLELRSSYGAANTLIVKGSHGFSGQTKQGSLNIQAISSSEQLKSLNVDLKGSILPGQGPDLPVELEGSAAVLASNSQGNIVDLKTQGDVKVGPTSGEAKGNLALNQIDPIAVNAGYNVKPNKQGVSSKFEVIYGKGQKILYDISLDRLAEHQYKLIVDIQTPVEGYKTAHLEVNSKRSKDNTQVSSAVELTVEGQTGKSNMEFDLSETSPSMDVKVIYTDGKVQQLVVKGNKASDRQFSGELKIINELNSFTWDSSVDVNIEDLENILLKGQINSPSLNLNKISFEAHNKGTSNEDRKIQIVVKTAGKNYISGSLTYQAKEENGKFIIDGSGNFKVKDESKSGNFKYITERLEQDKNGEQGVQISFNAALGDKAIDSEYKLTNKNFRWQNSYCEQKKECAIVEFDNKIATNDVEQFNQVLEINIDLRKLGVPHELGLKAVTNRKSWVIDHTVDIHFQDKNNKYQYSFYVHPTEAGLRLTTPMRVVALEGKTIPPKSLKEGGKSTGEIAFYMDKKNHADKKTALTWLLDIDLKGKANGEARFTHPGLRKPLLATFRATRQGSPYNGEIDIIGELDIFAQPNQKLVAKYHKFVNIDVKNAKGKSEITYSINSDGLGILVQGSEVATGDRAQKEYSYINKLDFKHGKTEYVNLASLEYSPKKILSTLKVLNTNLFQSTYTIQVGDNHHIVVESEISSFDNNPLRSRLEVKNLNTLSYSLGFDAEQNKILFNAGLIPGQIADIRAESQRGSTKKNLFYATVKLDDANFLKVDHKVDSKNIQDLAQRLRERSDKFSKGLENIGKEWAEEAKKETAAIGELAKKAAPNLHPLQNYYTKELKEFREEILNDKNIKELGQGLNKVLGSFIALVSDLIDKLSHLAEESTVIIQNAFQSVIAAMEKELIPHIKELTAKILQSANQVFHTVLDMGLNILSKAAETLERYQPELQELASAFGELFQDVGRFVFRLYENASENVRNLISRIESELKSSPFIEELQAQYQQLIREGIPSADVIVNSLREVFNTIKDLIPADFPVKEDINNILDGIANYAEKRLTGQKVDDIAALEEIGRSFALLFKKLLSIINVEDFKIPTGKLDPRQILSFSFLRNLPRLVAVRFSPLGYVVDQHTWLQLVQFLSQLWNHPRNLVPPFPLFGLIIQGQHIFTFDGNHLSFPGKCNYLFARDAVNGNFTLAGSFKDGLLASITLADDSGSSVTLIHGGKIKYNNEGVDLPLRKTTLAVWRDYELITLFAASGVRVECTPDLLGCVVRVSGFYHGQLRGLLGNGNSERYDDFAIPSGKIVTDIGQFANAYKLTASCADVAVAKHTSDNPTCNKLFGWESSMRLCYPFVSTDNFKTACSHGLAANVKGTEEAMAKAYVAACQDRNIPVHVPENLVKCTNSDKPYSVGETFSVKLPSKSADIVLIVDTDKANQQLYEKLVKNLVPEISTELHSKGVRDIEFHLITYGGLNQWPSHVTVNGKLTFKGKPPVLKFDEAPEESYEKLIKDIPNPNVQQVAEDLKKLLHDLSLATGLNLKTRTYDIAQNYPFRVNALKSIVVVNGKPCEIGAFAAFQRLLAYVYRNKQLSLNLFTPFTTLSAKDVKKTKDFVGFNRQNVFTLSQAKKNPKGSSELHKELNYEDYCVDFTLNNRGNVFINDNFLSASDADQKQFIHLAATNVVEQLVNLEQGLDCECTLVNPWHAENVCQEAYSKDRPSKKV